MSTSFEHHNHGAVILPSIKTLNVYESILFWFLVLVALAGIIMYNIYTFKYSSTTSNLINKTGPKGGKTFSITGLVLMLVSEFILILLLIKFHSSLN